MITYLVFVSYDTYAFISWKIRLPSSISVWLMVWVPVCIQNMKGLAWYFIYTLQRIIITLNSCLKNIFLHIGYGLYTLLLTRCPWHAFQVMVILKHIFTKCCMLFHYSKPYQNIHSEVEANNNSKTTSKISSKILIQCFLFFFLLPPYPTHHQLSVTMLPQPTNQITLRKPIQWYSNKNDNLSPLISTNQSNPSWNQHGFLQPIELHLWHLSHDPPTKCAAHLSTWQPKTSPTTALHTIPENRLGRSFVASAPPSRHKSAVNLNSGVKMRDPKSSPRKPRPSSVATSMPSFVRVETDSPNSSRSKSTDRSPRGLYSLFMFLRFLV